MRVFLRIDEKKGSFASFCINAKQEKLMQVSMQNGRMQSKTDENSRILTKF